MVQFKERFKSGLSLLGKLRVNVSHDALLSWSALFLVVFIAFTIRLMPMRWEIPTGSLKLSEFDPFYQFSLTNHMVKYGLLSPYWPTRWINTQQWYPWGLDMSMSLPSLPMLAAVLYDIISFLGVKVDLMTFCSLLPAFLGTLSCIVLYFVGKDVGGKSIGLLAALFLALSPSFIQRSSIGFFDTETVGILGLVLFMLLFLRAIEADRPVCSSLKYSVGAAGALAFFCGGWGAAYYLLGLSAIFILIMLLLKRYSRRLLLCYGVTFGLGLFIAINIPYLSPRYLTTAPVLAVAGAFFLLCLGEVYGSTLSKRFKTVVTVGVIAALVGGAVYLWQSGEMTNIAGKFISVVNPFLRASNPIIESVAEHKIASWATVYLEWGILLVFFLAGLYFTLRNPTDRNVFLLVFGLTGLYFASSMVRLLILLAPALSLIAAAGVLGVLKPFYTLLAEAPRVSVKIKRGITRVGKEYSGGAVLLIFLLLVTALAFTPQTGGKPRVYESAYTPVTISAGSLPIVPAEPVSQWLDMLSYTRNNLSPTTVVMSWWDYGDWLGIYGNVTTLCDNTTENTTQIENVGYSFMANETLSLKMLSKYNVSYVLVYVTLGLSQSSTGQYVAGFAGAGGDEGKWVWMARISGGARNRFLSEGFMTENYSWTNETAFGGYNNQTGQWVWGDMGTNSTIYKLMSWAKQRWCDKVGYVQPDTPGVQPNYFEEAYFAGLELDPYTASRNYGGIIPLVCLYKIDWAKYYNETSAG